MLRWQCLLSIFVSMTLTPFPLQATPPDMAQQAQQALARADVCRAASAVPADS